MDEEQLIARIERNKATKIRIRLVKFGGPPFGDVRIFVDGDGDHVLAQNAAPQNVGRLDGAHKLPKSAYRDWLQKFRAPGGCVNIA